MKEKPDCCDEAHLDFLDDLRYSEITNMFGARPYLLEQFPFLSKKEAGDVLTYWQDSFSERHG